MKKILTLFVMLIIAFSSFAQLNNKIDLLKVNDLTTKKFAVESTTNGATPCPSMTITQRNAIASPSEGQCIYNSTAKTLNIYDGLAWVEVAGGGGDGGISNWTTGKLYDVNDVVIEGDKIYQCVTLHTSTVFASDITNWKEISKVDLGSAEGLLDATKVGTGVIDNTEFNALNNVTSEIQTQLDGKEPAITVLPMSKGGTDKALVPQLGGVVYTDDGSMEILPPGTAGQVLKSNGAGSPSWVNKSISGKAQNASAVTLEEIQVPNSQITQTDVNKHLLETGNKNILVNPSFEHSTFSTGWTNSAGSFAEDLVVEVDGLKAAKVTLSSQALDLGQDSTLYQAQFADGVQGLAYARVKTSVAGVRLCARKAGANQTSLCMTHSGSGKWELLKVPFILGGTSNGLSINTASNVTGTVLVDDAFVGPVDLKVDTNNISTLVNYTPTITTASGTMTNYTAVGNWYRVGQFMHGSVTITFNGAVGTWTTPKFTLPSGYSMDLGNYPFDLLGSVVVRGSSSNSMVGVVYYDSFNTIGVTMGGVTTHTGTAPIVEPGLTNAFPFSLASGNSIRITFKVPISGWASSGSIYSSTNADTDWQTCTFASTSWQGLGTVSANAKCKRQGSDLLVRGDVTIGTVSSSTAQIPLPLFNGQSLTIADNSKNVNGLTAGRLYRYVSTNGFSKDAVLLASSSVGYLGISFAMEASTYNPLVPQTGVNLFGNNEYLMYEYRVPIQGWENSNIIIGQFNGLESCANTLQCTDTFSAYVGPTTGPVSQENVDWINGNASVTDTSLFTLTLNTGIFTQIPNCTIGLINNDNTVSVSHKIVTLTNTTIAIRTGYSNAANGFVKASDIPFLIICQKQGADYIGKTAKAVASDQNVRTNGLLKSVMYSGAFVVGASTPLQTYGDWIQSISSSGTGQVTFNFKTNTFASRPTCIITGYKTGAETNSYGCNLDIAATNTASSVSFRCNQNSTTAFNVSADILCHGQAP